MGIDTFSGRRVTTLDIVSTRDRGWESPKYLVSTDQGRIQFGCEAFDCVEEPAGL